MEELLKYMKALVILQARAIAETQPGLKLDVLLAGSGLSHREIAEVLGKSPTAVAKSISRAKNEVSQ